VVNRAVKTAKQAAARPAVLPDQWAAVPQAAWQAEQPRAEQRGRWAAGAIPAAVCPVALVKLVARVKQAVVTDHRVQQAAVAVRAEVLVAAKAAPDR
jgi:hypothetical protein